MDGWLLDTFLDFGWAIFALQPREEARHGDWEGAVNLCCRSGSKVVVVVVVVVVIVAEVVFVGERLMQTRRIHSVCSK